AALAVACACAAVARIVVPPTTRLAPRVRPYLVTVRGLEHSTTAVPLQAVAHRSTFGRLFAPPLVAALRRVGRFLERRSDEHLERLLWQAGFNDVTPDEYRV